MTGRPVYPPIRDPDKTLEVLSEISSAVSQTRSLQELYRAIHKSLHKLLNVDNFYIAIHHPERDSITFPYHVDEMDEDPEEIFDFSKTSSSTGRVIQQKKPLIFYEEDILALVAKLQTQPMGTVCKVWLGAPLIVRNRVTGVVTIQSYRSATIYNRTDLELLNAVSHHIALAIERKESEACLARQNQLLEKILESSPVGIACLENGVFKWVNTEMVHMFGYESKDAFENKPVQMLYSSTMDCDASLKSLYADLTSAGKAEQNVSLVKRDKSRFPANIRMNSSDLSDPMARPIAIFTDISQKIATEQELCEKERLQGVLEMAGAVCHELNQPLQAILGYTELLLMNQGGNRDTNLYAIKTQAGRIETIARKLSTVTCYKTIDYPGNTKIVDIWHSGTSH